MFCRVEGLKIDIRASTSSRSIKLQAKMDSTGDFDDGSWGFLLNRRVFYSSVMILKKINK